MDNQPVRLVKWSLPARICRYLAITAWGMLGYIAVVLLIIFVSLPGRFDSELDRNRYFYISWLIVVAPAGIWLVVRLWKSIDFLQENE